MRLRAVAVAGLVLAAGWQFYGRSVVPLRNLAADARRDVTDLKARIDTARKTIAETKAMEKNASRRQSPHEDIPGGSPLVWFPVRMEQHFAREGISGAVTRLNTTLTEPELPDFERTYWAVEIPLEKSPGEFRKACVAVMEIEPVDPSIRVLDVEIRDDANDPARRVLVMNVATLVRKADAVR